MSEGPGTRSVHGGERPDPSTGALNTPIYRTTTFRFDTTDDLLAAARGERPGYYTRYGHPNFDVVERKFAMLHGAEAAISFASGLAATSAVLLGHLRTGDRVVAQRDLYGGTRDLLGELESRLGIPTTFVPLGDLAALERAARGARLVVAEGPTNPTLRLPDLPKVAAVSHAAGAIVLFDNTFATPINQRPLGLGADLVVESATKSLGGHSDVMGGLVAGSKALVDPLHRTRKLFGAVLDPDAAWLLARGMKTLAARVERQNRTGLQVARWLEAHPKVARVLYPGLPSHPEHELAKRQLAGPAGGAGGMVTFACRGGLSAARRVADGVRMIANATSLGGVESLVSLPVYTSHAMFSAAEREAAGIGDDLVRLSLGLEDPDDLCADLDRALGGTS